MPLPPATLPSVVNPGPNERFLEVMRRTLDTTLRAVISRLNALETEGYHEIGASGEIAYQNNWSGGGGLSASARYAKNHNLVELVGSCQKTVGNIPFLQTITQLPEGYIPEILCAFPVSLSAGASWTPAPVANIEWVAIFGKDGGANAGLVVWAGVGYTQTGSDPFKIDLSSAKFKVG